MFDTYDAVIISFLLAWLLFEVTKVIADVFPLIEYDYARPDSATVEFIGDD